MRYILFSIFSLSLLLAPGGCSSPSSNSSQTSARTVAEEAAPDTLRLALDWRPNALHSGIFWAQKQGWYDSLNLYLDWFSPEVDDYQKKPIWRLQDQEVDLAIGPSEHIMRYGAAGDTAPEKAVQSIGSILQESRSAFVTKPGSGLRRPADLDGRRYGGYHTPLEEAILRSMIQHDGGKGDFQTVNPPRLSVWDAFQRDSVAVCWVFLHWEAIQWQQAEPAPLNAFIPNDYGVPYGYSSVFFAPRKPSARQESLYRRFLEATSRGYTTVAQQPRQVARRLVGAIEHPNYRDSSLLEASITNLAGSLLRENRWGHQKTQIYEDYLRWIRKQDLGFGKERLEAERLFSNQYLPEEGKENF